MAIKTLDEIAEGIYSFHAQENKEIEAQYDAVHENPVNFHVLYKAIAKEVINYAIKNDIRPVLMYQERDSWDS